MAEQLVNEFTVNRPIDEAWAVITDVEKIAAVPARRPARRVRGRRRLSGRRVKLGSITPSFKGQADVHRPQMTQEHRAVLKAEGRDTGGRGRATAEITAQAESLSPSTRCVVTTDLHITGRVAQFRRGILGDVSKKLMAQFASNLNTMLDEQGPNGRASTNGDADGTAAEAGVVRTR